MSDVSDTAPPRPAPGLWNLFRSFVTVSVFGFGGTLAWARRMAVDERRWMTATEFNEVFALCQFLPGPNVMNFAVVFGARVRGAPGAIVAAVGLSGPSLILMIVLGMLYSRYGDIASLQRILGGVTTAAAGLILGTTARMAQPLFQSKQWMWLGMTAAVMLAVGILKLSLWWALAIFVPLCIAVAWKRPR